MYNPLKNKLKDLIKMQILGSVKDVTRRMERQFADQVKIFANPLCSTGLYAKFIKNIQNSKTQPHSKMGFKI